MKCHNQHSQVRPPSVAAVSPANPQGVAPDNAAPNLEVPERLAASAHEVTRALNAASAVTRPDDNLRCCGHAKNAELPAICTH